MTLNLIWGPVVQISFDLLAHIRVHNFLLSIFPYLIIFKTHIFSHFNICEIMMCLTITGSQAAFVTQLSSPTHVRTYEWQQMCCCLNCIMYIVRFMLRLTAIKSVFTKVIKVKSLCRKTWNRAVRCTFVISEAKIHWQKNACNYIFFFKGITQELYKT